MADYLDTFTAADGTAISDRASDSGHTYETTTHLKIYNNNLQSVLQGTTGNPQVPVYEADGTTLYETAGEFDLTVITQLVSNNGEISLQFCKDIGLNDSYAITYSLRGIDLNKFVDGSFSRLGTAETVANGDSFVVEVRATTLTVKRNGSTVIGPIADTAVTRVGSVVYPTGRGVSFADAGYQWRSVAIANLAADADYTARKGATGVEVTHNLTADGITSQTLGGEAVTLVSQSGQVVTLDFDESAILTSGEIDLVLGDGVDTETFTVQYNVIGLPSNTLLKDGAALASLTDVKLTVLDASGTRLDRQTGLTTDASGLTGVTPVAAGAVDDPVEVSVFSPGSEVGIVYETTLGLL